MSNNPAGRAEEGTAPAQLPLPRASPLQHLEQNWQRQRQHTTTNASSPSPLHSPTSLIPQPSSRIPTHLDEPDLYYTSFNAEQGYNNRSVRENSGYNMASSVAHPPKQPMSTTSRVNSNGTRSRTSEFTIPRKEFPSSAALRTTPDSANSKLHPAKPTTGKSVKEMANRFNNVAVSTTISPKQVEKGHSKLPSTYRSPHSNVLSSDKMRAVSESNTRVGTRVGQTTRDSGTKVSSTARPSTRNGKMAQDQGSNTTPSRVRASSQVPGGRKPIETTPMSTSLPKTTSPTKLAATEKPLLFGELPNHSATGVGHGIPTAHARSPSDPAAEAVVISLQATENPPQTPAQLSRSVPTGRKSPHSRSHSDALARKSNVVRRPLYQSPSSRSSTSSENSKAIKPSKPRVPVSRPVNDLSSSSTPSSTRSNSPHSAPKISPKAAVQPHPRTKTPTGRYAPRARPANFTSNTTRVNATKTSSYNSKPAVSVADKTTAASRNREAEATSRPRPNSRTGSPPKHPLKRPIRPLGDHINRNTTPLENVDFPSIRKGICAQFQKKELQRRESIRQQKTQPVLAELEKDEAIKDNIDDALSKGITESVGTNLGEDIKETKITNILSLTVDTSMAPEAPADQDTTEDFQQRMDDSPTLGIPGSFPTSLQSPMFQEIPQSAVSNATDTTDIENDPQDEFHMPGGFNATRLDYTSAAFRGDCSSVDISGEENHEAQSSGLSDTEALAAAITSSNVLQQSVAASEVEEESDKLVENVAPQIPPVVEHTGQFLSPVDNDFLQSRVHEQLRETDEESIYDYSRSSDPRTSQIDQGNRNSGAWSSDPRTSQIDQGNRNSGAWTDYTVATASDSGLGGGNSYNEGTDIEDDYERPPTPPPKILTIPALSSESRPITPLTSAPINYAGPPLPLSPPLPQVPPKPANYSPLPSPRTIPPISQSPTPRDDAPLSPRSEFGTVAVLGTHSRTSSSTPHYAPGTGWIAQPPVPVSRPTSSSMDDLFNGIATPATTNTESDPLNGTFTPATIRTAPASENGATSGTEEQATSQETEEQALARQKVVKALRDRRNIIKEIIDSEAKHVKDMFVIKEIWQGTADACPNLTSGDKDVLFGNINEIAAFGARFLESLKKANSSVYDSRRGPDGKKRSIDDNSINAHTDNQSCIGGVFVEFSSQIEHVNWPFIINFQQGQKHLEELLKDPAIKIWDQECRRAMVDISECWDLQSLIIKPYQRIIKYKDLLERLISKTSTDHPDWEKLQVASASFKDMLVRLNEAMPSEPSKVKVPTRKRKESESRTGFMKTLARKTIKNTPVVIPNPLKPTDKDDEYARLRRTFGEDYVRLQVVMRDVEFYTRQVTESVNSFLKILGCIEMFVISKPLGPFPELESKWSRFNISMQSIRHTALPNHINIIRTQFITPFDELIKLYSGPNLKMSERTRRRVDWEKIIVGKEKWTFAKDHQRKIEKSAERFMELNEEIKKDLPVLSQKTNQIANYCLARFILVQMDWFNMWQQKVGSVLEDNEIKAVLQDLRNSENASYIVQSFFRDHESIDRALEQLTITKRSRMDEFKDYPIGRTSTQESENQFSIKGRDSSQRSRPPSSNGRVRPAPVRTRAASTNGSPSLPTPDFGHHTNGGFFTPMEPNAPVSQSAHGLGLAEPPFRFHDSNSMSDTLVNSQPPSMYPSSGRPSTNTSRSPIPAGGYESQWDDTYRKHSDVSDLAYPPRDSESGYYRRESDPSERSYDYYDRSRPVSGSTTFSTRIDGPPLNGRPSSGLDGPSNSSRPFSGVFQSAMPLSDGPETYNTRMSRTSSLSSLDRNDERNRGDGYNVLYLAASLFEFHIEDTKREGIYPYLTYEAGELFDVIGEKGELWLAKNQDDPPDKIKVGWIWSKHFARLAD